MRSKSGREVDTDGIEFDSLDYAIQDARRAGAEIVAEKSFEGKPTDPESVFEITDMSGKILAEVPFLPRDISDRN